MSTELAKVAGVSDELLAEFPMLDVSSEAHEMLTDRMKSGGFNERDLIQIKVPSQGSEIWTWKDITGAKSAEELVGIIIGMSPHGMLWPSEGLNRDKQRPILETFDMRIAHRRGEELGDIPAADLERARVPAEESGGEELYYWQMLPQTKFESAGNGRGKRVKEGRILYLLMPGRKLPVRLDLPATSIAPCDRYAQQLFDVGKLFHSVKTGISLSPDANVDGEPFSRAKFRCIETVDYKVGKQLFQLYGMRFDSGS